MFQINDYVIYKRDLCIVKEIKKSYYQNQDYYVLIPVDDCSLKIEIPVSNKSKLLRSIITKEEAKKLIQRIPAIESIHTSDKVIENEYRNLLHSNNHEDLIRIIKTTYSRNEERKSLGKKLGDKDSFYFEKAEKCLYNELSIVFDMSYEDCKSYILKCVETLNQNENF